MYIFSKLNKIVTYSLGIININIQWMFLLLQALQISLAWPTLGKQTRRAAHPVNKLVFKSFFWAILNAIFPLVHSANLNKQGSVKNENLDLFHLTCSIKIANHVKPAWKLSEHYIVYLKYLLIPKVNTNILDK